MATWAANLAGVLVALGLLGIVVWIVAIGVLAYMVSREVITAGVLMRAGIALLGSAIVYAGLVILVGALVSP